MVMGHRFEPKKWTPMEAGEWGIHANLSYCRRRNLENMDTMDTMDGVKPIYILVSNFWLKLHIKRLWKGPTHLFSLLYSIHSINSIHSDC